jgi:hypothetical protein
MTEILREIDRNETNVERTSKTKKARNKLDTTSFLKKKKFLNSEKFFSEGTLRSFFSAPNRYLGTKLESFVTQKFFYYL